MVRGRRTVNSVNVTFRGPRLFQTGTICRWATRKSRRRLSRRPLLASFPVHSLWRSTSERHQRLRRVENPLLFQVVSETMDACSVTFRPQQSRFLFLFLHLLCLSLCLLSLIWRLSWAFLPQTRKRKRRLKHMQQLKICRYFKNKNPNNLCIFCGCFLKGFLSKTSRRTAIWRTQSLHTWRAICEQHLLESCLSTSAVFIPETSYQETTCLEISPTQLSKCSFVSTVAEMFLSLSWHVWEKKTISSIFSA